MEFNEKHILIEGNNVSYVDEGQPGGIPIIFIHGFPFNKETWSNQLEVLKESYRVIAYDVRGYGNSETGNVLLSVPQFAGDLFSFMDALEIETVIVCGLSMGGYIALNAIHHQPERISALILCDTQCMADSEEAKKKRMDTIVTIQKNGLSTYAHDSVMKLFSETSLNDKPEEVSSIEQTILQTRSETIINTLRALAERKETCSSLHNISIPVLILVGEDDQITPPPAAQKMNSLITGSRLQVIKNAGHLSNLENPDSFNSHLQIFLTTIEQVSTHL